MAGKITELTALTAVDHGDLTVVIDDPAGTPVSKKATALNVVGAGNWLRVLDSDATGSNVNTAQPWFPTSGGITLTAGETYKFEGYLRTSRSAGTTSHTTGIGFGGTATFTFIAWKATTKTGDTAASAAENAIMVEAATNTTVKAASTSATEQFGSRVEGILKVNAGGTFIPQFTYSAAPGGAPTIKAGSHFMLTRLGESTLNNRGGWA